MVNSDTLFKYKIFLSLATQICLQGEYINEMAVENDKILNLTEMTMLFGHVSFYLVSIIRT